MRHLTQPVGSQIERSAAELTRPNEAHPSYFCRSQPEFSESAQKLSTDLIHWSFCCFFPGNTGFMVDPLRAHGIARSSSLLTHGWTRHSVARALSAGQLVRPRKGWVARPSCDPELLFAAQHGLILTCVTQAKRLGLWSHDQSGHYAVRHAGAEIRPEGAVLHWRAPLIPRHPDSVEDSLVNTLDSVAHCLPLEEAVAVWDSALNKKLIDPTMLAKFAFKGIAKQVLAESVQFADSGLESYVRQRLSWLRVRVVTQAWVLGHRVDFLIGKRLVLQVDGGHHVGAQRTSDNKHDAELRLRGYTVIRVGYAQVMGDWPSVQQQIMLAIGQGLHLDR